MDIKIFALNNNLIILLLAYIAIKYTFQLYVLKVDTFRPKLDSKRSPP